MQFPKNNLTSQSSDHEYWADYLRVIAILQVVAIHSINDRSAAVKPLSFYPYLGFLIEPAICLFFLISGYVLIKKYGESINYITYYKKRSKRVLWPYFAFSILYIGLRTFLAYTTVFGDDKITDVPFYISDVFIDLALAGAAPHLYFLLAIYILYLLFPLVRIICGNRWSALSVLVIYHFLHLFLEDSYQALGLKWPQIDVLFNVILGMKYFLIGINLYWFRSILWDTLRKWGIPLFILFLGTAVFLKFYMSPDYKVLARYFLVSSYLVLSIALGEYRLKVVGWLSGLSFGIYLIHRPVVADLLIKVVGVPSPSFLNPWVVQAGYFISVVAVSCLGVMAIKKYRVLHFIMFGEGK